MSRHRFRLDDFIEQIADERGCRPEEVVIDNIEVPAKHSEIIIDARETNPLRDDQ